MLRRFVLIAGRRQIGTDEVLAGDSSGHRVGDEIVIGKRPRRVVGVYHSGDRFVDVGLVAPLAVVQRLRSGRTR